MFEIDVIVPCYRYGRYLRQCVESILGQEGVRARVLIIDDASPDDTASIADQLASEDRRVSVIHHATNMGHIATYNEGIEWVSSPFYLLLSADDYLISGALERAARLFSDHPDVGFIFGMAKIQSQGGTMREVRPFCEHFDTIEDRILLGEEFLELTKSRNRVPTPTAVIRTSIQKKIGGYRPELPHTGDLEMWLRLAANASVGFVGAFQAVYRQHGDNMFEDYLKNGRIEDLRQRKAAIDLFAAAFSGVLPKGLVLCDLMRRELASDVVAFASATFNEGNDELTGQLSDLALSISPEVRRSWGWRKLGLKKVIGKTVWRSVAPSLKSVLRRTSDRHE